MLTRCFSCNKSYTLNFKAITICEVVGLGIKVMGTGTALRGWDGDGVIVCGVERGWGQIVISSMTL